MVKTSPSNAGVEGSNPGQGVKIPQALGPKKKNKTKKQKQYCNKFDKDFKKMVHIKKKTDKMKIYNFMLFFFFGGYYLGICMEIWKEMSQVVLGPFLVQ